MQHVRLFRNGPYWRLRWKLPNGQLRHESLGRLTKREAEVARAKREAELMLAPDPGGHAPTIGDWLRHRREARASLVQKRTAMVDADTERWLLRYFAGTARMDSVTPAQVEDWLRLMREEGLAPVTVAGHVRRASAIWTEARRRGLLARNPWEAVKVEARPIARAVPVLDDTQVARLIDAAPPGPWQRLIGLCGYAGLRLGEAMELDWGDVDWAGNRLRVHAPKTGRTRYVRLEPALAALLAREEEREGRICPVCPWNLNRQMLAVAVRAGVGRYPKPFHALRASRATVWRRSYPEHVVDAWLGHSLAVARKHYVTVEERYFAVPESPEAYQNRTKIEAETH